MNKPKILKLLKTQRIGRDIWYLETIDSTSSELKRIMERAPRQSIVIADHQSAGRGRSSNTWFSPERTNLYFSLSLDVGKLSEKDIYPISAVIGVALHRALSSWTSGNLSLKWPNDLYLEGKKLAGILSEIIRTKEEKNFVVVGIGVNVNMKEFPSGLNGIATSLLVEEKKKFEREEILASILNEVDAAVDSYEKEGIENLLAEYRKRCSLWGKRIAIDGIEGIMQDISSRGGLLLKQDDGNVKEIFAGTVQFL